MTVTSRPWWDQVDRAAALLTSAVAAAVAEAARRGTYRPPPGSPPPRRARRPGSLRHLAETIRAHRLAPGFSVDKDTVAAVLAGDLKRLTDPVPVVEAAYLIAGTPFEEYERRRLAVACDHLADLVAQARKADEREADEREADEREADEREADERQADERAPRLVPVKRASGALVAPRPPMPRRRRRTLAVVIIAALIAAVIAAGLGVAGSRDNGGGPTKAAESPATTACRDGTAGDDVIGVSTAVFRDDQATRLTPTLDFDQMNGSARYARYRGRTYYWGRAGSDDDRPAAGGARVRWRTAAGPWHSCATALPSDERGYVHTPAVATTIGGVPVTVQVCLWRDVPRRENCTAELATG